MHKIWFYISLLSLLIGGVYCSLPSEAERAQMKAAAQKRKAEKAQKAKSPQAPTQQSDNTVLPQSASTP